MCNDCNVYYQQFAESQQNDSMQLETAAMVLLGRIPCFSRRDSAVVYTRSMQTLVPRGTRSARLVTFPGRSSKDVDSEWKWNLHAPQHSVHQMTRYSA